MKERNAKLSLFVFFSLLLKSLFVKYSIMDELNIVGFLTEMAFLALFIIMVSSIRNKVSSILLLILNLGYSVLCLTTLLYFDYYNTIFTYKSLGEIDQVGEISDSIFALFKLQYIWLFFDFILLCFWPKLKRILPFSLFQLGPKLFGLTIALLLFFTGTSLFSSSKIINELSKYEKLGIMGYQFSEAATDLHSIFSNNDISAESLQKNRHLSQKGTSRLFGIAKDKNLIIVQLESVQNFFINLKINGKEVTPNLNKLVKSSYYFPHFYSQVGKGNTSDAEFITNTSIYPLGDVPMSTAVEGKAVPSLPRILGDNGYHTATFHANSVTFWNRNRLYQSLGFKEYYDKKYFGTNDIISYGVSDVVMYHKTIQKLADFHRNGKNFYADIIALSSHFPFKLPESKQVNTVPLPKEYDNSFVGSYIKAVSYADYAFGKFIEELKRAGLYKDSVIVVYGDHQGLQIKTDQDKQIVQKIFGRKYDSVLDHLNIPLIVKVPSVEKAKNIPTVGGLVDIYPTVANLLGLDISKQIVFGNDLLNVNKNQIGIRFYAPTGTFVNQFYRFSPGKTNDQGKILSLNERKERAAPASAIKEEEKMIKYMKLSDQYVKSFPKLK
ncbi:LTA synthase family protein [Neobacillus niacini]|uniref:LTA synthase family protein n=1 Tax=Neobacillus niacini TaxID=86668 RepID=UPI00285F2B88|nr:LTA synthase family protein [Neobacillus niacini]MDR7001655.1 phosphoglycerol transferase MdoB-like AlkP superfamily enzyme [Neobacillus niacini]